ncbi:uncharacterized protein Adk2 [Planococcus citri]|uniref:uncharacterized protein Adk2 n=1 Tax=Planococcus citri TaxID=170843 RepID=UPI0031F8F340
MSSELRNGMLLCLGNPLLDISAYADEELLKKYDLKPNNAILAEAKHRGLNEDLTENYDVDYIAGGASQNTARIAQSILRKPNTVVYMGCVGKDFYSEMIEKKARADGVDVRYQYTDKRPTGTCAVIITDDGKHRSLVANLAAAELFSIDHIRIPENREIIDKADYFYLTGFFLIVSPDSALEIAKVALEKNKVLAMNLSAPYICESFNRDLTPLLPYIDILFGNETEAAAFSKQYNLGTENLEEIALKIADLPKNNAQRKRLVVITQGEKPVIVARDSTVKQFEVIMLPNEKIVDTNGAGDAFVGGFLSQLIQEQSYEVCIQCGNWAASEVVQQSGCIFKTTQQFCPRT